MTDVPITEPRTWNGYWTIPNSDKRFPGILHFDPSEGLSLELFSRGFESPYVESKAKPKVFNGPDDVTVISYREAFYPVIYGRSENTDLTLTDVQMVSSKGPMSFERSLAGASTFNVSSAIVGALVPDPEDTLIKGIYFRIDHLVTWIGHSRELKSRLTFNDGKRIEESTRMSFETEIGTWEGVRLSSNIELDFPPSWTWQNPESNAYSYRHRYNEFRKARFRYLHSINLRQALGHGYWLASLMSLSLDTPCGLQGIQIETAPGGGKSGFANLIIARRVQLPKESFSSRVSQDYFTAEKLSISTLNKVLSNWYKMNDSIAAPISLAENLLDSPSIHLETEILLTSVMSESLHKSHFRTITDASEEALTSVAPGYWDFKSFWARITDLFHRLDRETRDSLVEDWVQWSRTLRDARNSIAHEAHISESDQLSSLASARLAQIVVRLLIFQEIGVPNEILRTSAENTKSFSAAVHLASKYLFNSLPSRND